ncbi:unnamed protein product [Clavelina lepadiformis]|uniref:Uncharacterized protein n=1 Tax=Clavelina lepadiformis TaxID=159417 RepID=A0ABP0GVY6_CLALP
MKHLLYLKDCEKVCKIIELIFIPSEHKLARYVDRLIKAHIPDQPMAKIRHVNQRMNVDLPGEQEELTDNYPPLSLLQNSPLHSTNKSSEKLKGQIISDLNA